MEEEDLRKLLQSRLSFESSSSDSASPPPEPKGSAAQGLEQALGFDMETALRKALALPLLGKPDASGVDGGNAAGVLSQLVLPEPERHEALPVAVVPEPESTLPSPAESTSGSGLVRPEAPALLGNPEATPSKSVRTVIPISPGTPVESRLRVIGHGVSRCSLACL